MRQALAAATAVQSESAPQRYAIALGNGDALAVGSGCHRRNLHNCFMSNAAPGQTLPDRSNYALSVSRAGRGLLKRVQIPLYSEYLARSYRV